MSTRDAIEDDRKYLEGRIRYFEDAEREAQAALPRLRRALAAMIGTPYSTEDQPKSDAGTGKQYKNTSTVNAAIDFLRQRGRSASTAEITDGLLRGGWKSKAHRKTATVFGMLRNHAEGPKATIVKTGHGTWGLAEWRSVQEAARIEPSSEGSEGTS